MSIHGGYGSDMSMGPALEKLRRDNQLLDEVHDPAEDEPHIVGIPHKFTHQDTEPPAVDQPHS